MSVNAPSLQLSDYLEKLPGTTFRRLYQQPSTAFAIFRRMLPDLAKTFVMWQLYMPTPLALSDIDVRIKPEARRLKDQALSILRALHIVQITAAGKDRPQEMTLTSNFKTSMRLTLEGGGSHNSFGVPSELAVPEDIDVVFLDRYARTKWEAILHYVVNSVGLLAHRDTGGPKQSVKELLQAGRLVERRDGGKGPLEITQAGFRFLLQEANAQVWTLLLLWLESADSEAVDMLSFLFMLASLELGRAYDTGALPEARRNMLPYLVDFGLVYIPPQDPRQYFPTRLATTLTSSPGGSSALRSVPEGFDAAAREGPHHPSHQASGATAGEKGSIILETNYRLYAYTTSPLQIAVLALFTRLNLRFPNMVSGKLTRGSIRQAIGYGITADQIILYLSAHAHPEMHRLAGGEHRPLLPPTLVDQIRLWQLENERMKTTAGFLFKDFDSGNEYEELVTYADQIGVLVWKNDKRRMFFANKYEQLRDYLRVKKKAD